MRRFVVAFVLVHCALSVAPRSARTSELIDMSQLGDQGIVFESPAVERGNIDGTGGIGDFNGDGFDDIVVLFREPRLGPDAPPRYATALVYGGPRRPGRYVLGSDLPGSAIFRPSSVEPGDGGHYPDTIGAIGDQNGDGLADFVLQYGRLQVEGALGRGTAFLFHGTAGLEGDHAPEEVGDTLPGIVIFSSDATHGSIGRAVANVGDFNGDGKDDLAVGAPTSENLRGEKSAGAVFLLFGIEDLPPRVDLAEVGRSLPGLRVHGAAWETELIGFIGFLGSSIKPVGDFDGDGLPDVLVAASELRPRTVYLIRGGADYPAVIDFAESQDVEGITRFTDDTRSFAGRDQFAGAGDINGDGLADVLIAASRFGFLGTNSVAHLFYGRAEFPPVVRIDEVPAGLSTRFEPLRHGDGFGISTAGAGDLNSDGIPDLLIGANRTRGDAGDVYATFGQRDFGEVVRLAEGFDGILLEGENGDDNLGAEASSAGDFNGDGAVDILVSAPHATGTGEPGRVYVIFGTGTGELPLRLFAVEPDHGPKRGGADVVLHGSGFRGAPMVTFGGRAASAVTVLSASQVSARIPPADAPAVVDVAITLDGGTATLRDGFEYTENVPSVDLADLEGRGFILEGAAGESLGRSVAFGDLTGDGIDELVAVGSRADRLAVTIVHGGPDLPPRLTAFEASPRLSLITSVDPAARRAGEVAVAGDVNGDGMGDVLLGAGAARAFLLFGREELPAEIVLEDELIAGRAVALESAAVDAGGFHLAPVGDITGDGLADFAIGFVESRLNPDPNAPLVRHGRGEVVFIAGRAAWPEFVDIDVPASVLSRLVGSRPDQAFGRQITLVGDANGDGLDDLLVGSASSPAVTGCAHLIYGSPDLPPESAVDSLVDGGGGMRLEVDLDRADDLDVGAAGDVDADGFADLLVGSRQSGGDFEGVTLLVRGGADLPTSMQLSTSAGAADGLLRVFGEGSETYSGASVTAGDFDADGHDDFLIRASGLLESPSLERLFGTAFLVFGGAELPRTIHLERLRGQGLRVDGRPPGAMNLPAKESGDLNGDGRPDFALMENRLVPDGPEASELYTLYVIYGLSESAPFVRGNANFDGEVNLSDAVFTLARLFGGGPGPLCEDAADADDDGVIRITDAIYLFEYLFGDGPEPPPPFPAEGDDPSADDLECRGF